VTDREKWKDLFDRPKPTAVYSASGRRRRRRRRRRRLRKQNSFLALQFDIQWH
jgi:hypothetical protein